MMKTTLTVLTVLILSAGLGLAAPIDCTQPAGIDVMAIGADGCFIGGNVYDMWSVGGTNAQTVSLSNLTGIGPGGVQNLKFTLTPQDPTGDADTTLRYRVTGGILGVDLGITNATGATTIAENVCTGNFCGEADSALLVTLGPLGVAGYDEIFFTAESQVYISKDINVPEGSSLSDFTNSHHIPEPTTLLLMGTGLFALGFGRKYLRRDR